VELLYRVDHLQDGCNFVGKQGKHMSSQQRRGLRAATVLYAAVLCSVIPLATVVHARTVVVEETRRIELVDPDYELTGPLAIQGRDLLIIGFQRAGVGPVYGLFHYERQADGGWLKRGLVAGLDPELAVSWGVSLDDGIAVFHADRNQGWILERTASGWTKTPLTLPAGLFSDFTSGVRVVDGTIALGGRRELDAVALLKKNAAGQWAVTNVLQASPTDPDFDHFGPSFAFTGTQVAIPGFRSRDNEVDPGPETHIYEVINGQWQRTALLSGAFGPVAFDSEIALQVGSDRARGELVQLNRRGANGAWNLRTTLYTEESFDSNLWDISGNRAYASAPFSSVRGGPLSGSLSVFERDSQGRYIHRANLLASDGAISSRFLGWPAARDGSRVVAAATSFPDANGKTKNLLYVFDLPPTFAQPVRVQDTFEDLNSAGWTPVGVTNWRVVSAGGSQVFRQNDVSGNARAILDAPILRNQSIEADVKVQSVQPASWVGLTVRYTDALNFYYLLVRDGTIQIRRNVNGTFGPIATATFALTPGRAYRFRLEAIGKQLRAYVDGRQVLLATDTSLPQGKAGLTMWKAAVDYDNVIVTNSPNVPLFGDAFSRSFSAPWTASPAGAWNLINDAEVFQQSMIEGDARAVNGAPAADQIISADIRPTAFNASGTGWVGLMARYRDDRNYYYVLLKSSGKAALRKVVDGQLTLFEEVPFTVTPGTSYRVRLEAIGNELRLYVNGRLLAEGVDSALPTGRYGLVTYRATAQFDNFSAVRP
jgi:hypothetical protein